MVETIAAIILALCPQSGTVVQSFVQDQWHAQVSISSCDDCAALAIINNTEGALTVECTDTGDIIAVRE